MQLHSQFMLIRQNIYVLVNNEDDLQALVDEVRYGKER